MAQVPPDAYNYVSTMEYKDGWDWFVQFKNPLRVWEEMPAYVINELVFTLGGLLCFIHACSRGGRWPFLFFGAIAHGLVVEYLSYLLPDIDSFWHAQTSVMFFGQRLPLYVNFLYVVFFYQSSWAVSKLKLRCPYAEALAAGLLVILIDIPLDLVGVRYMFWTWHDTDPNIFERNYFVPWNSYLFHLFFTTSFQLAFHKTRKLFDRRNLDKWQRGTWTAEIGSTALAALLGMPGGSLLILCTYHVLHDFLLVPTEVVVMTCIAISIVIVWFFDRWSKRHSEVPQKKTFVDKLLLIHLVLHYTTFLLIPLFFKPETHVSVGLHEPVGDCEKVKPLQTLLATLSKKEFLCATDYDEPYFDFKCLKELPPPNSNWYTICGTHFENRAEFIWIQMVIAFCAFIIFSAIHSDLGKRSTTKVPAAKSVKVKTK